MCTKLSFCLQEILFFLRARTAYVWLKLRATGSRQGSLCGQVERWKADSESESPSIFFQLSSGMVRFVLKCNKKNYVCPPLFPVFSVKHFQFVSIYANLSIWCRYFSGISSAPFALASFWSRAVFNCKDTSTPCLGCKVDFLTRQCCHAMPSGMAHFCFEVW